MQRMLVLDDVESPSGHRPQGRVVVEPGRTWLVVEPVQGAVLGIAAKVLHCVALFLVVVGCLDHHDHLVVPLGYVAMPHGTPVVYCLP